MPSTSRFLFFQDHLSSGGAARAAGRWKAALELNGLPCRQVAGDLPPPEGCLLTGKPARGWARIREFFGDRLIRRTKTVEGRLRTILARESPDLIWIHNLAGAGKWGWSEQMVSIARPYAPVLWTLHDMWALGNSSESYWETKSAVEGGEWKDAGKAKVEGGREQGARIDGFQASRVQKIFAEGGTYPVILTAPSRWLADLARELTGIHCAFLPNPIDLEIFSPGERRAARRRLGLPEKGLLVLAGADSLQDQRKGMDLLREAWKGVSSGQATLALFGRHGKNRPGERYLGNLPSDEEMAAAYRAADLYVHPARMENAPCTIQESLACGTPVLAFAVGGIPEMIRPGKTGFLASGVTAPCLQQGLESVLADPGKLHGMSKECREHAEEEWKPEKLVRRLEELVGGKKTGGPSQKAALRSLRSEDGE